MPARTSIAIRKLKQFQNWQFIHNYCKTIFHLQILNFVDDEVRVGCPKIGHTTLYTFILIDLHTNTYNIYYTLLYYRVKCPKFGHMSLYESWHNLKTNSPFTIVREKKNSRDKIKILTGQANVRSLVTVSELRACYPIMLALPVLCRKKNHYTKADTNSPFTIVREKKFPGTKLRY